jgi:ATP-dependent Clp protease protease subunit
VLEDIKKQARPPDAGYAFSRKAVTNTLLNKVPVANTEPAVDPQSGQAAKPLYERLYLLRF